MFKKLLLTLAVGALVLGTAAFLFKDQAMSRMTKDMFVSADADAFDPGLQLGAQFPAIKAIHGDKEIVSIAPFLRDKGMIFIANRSASW